MPVSEVESAANQQQASHGLWEYLKVKKRGLFSRLRWNPALSEVVRGCEYPSDFFRSYSGNGYFSCAYAGIFRGPSICTWPNC